jgi:hypothetical protein
LTEPRDLVAPLYSVYTVHINLVVLRPGTHYLTCLPSQPSHPLFFLHASPCFFACLTLSLTACLPSYPPGSLHVLLPYRSNRAGFTAVVIPPLPPLARGTDASEEAPYPRGESLATAPPSRRRPSQILFPPASLHIILCNCRSRPAFPIIPRHSPLTLEPRPSGTMTHRGNCLDPNIAVIAGINS